MLAQDLQCKQQVHTEVSCPLRRLPRPGRYRVAHCRLTYSQRGQSSRPQATAEKQQQTEQTEEPQLEGIDKNYCDDFVCTSSPAVEQNVKALARDLLRLNTYTGSLYVKGIKYKVQLHTLRRLYSAQ